MDKKTNSTKATAENDNFANDVLPSYEIEDNPVIYAVKRNDRFYIVAFGKLLLPNAFANLEELTMYVNKHQAKLIQLALLAHWASSHNNEINNNSKNV